MITHLKQHTLITVFSLWLINTALAAPTIQLSPNTAVSGGEEIHLTATGDDPPYLWLTEAGDLHPLNDNGTEALLTTPHVAGDFTLTLIDSHGTQTQTQFQVIWQRFSVTPEYVYIEPGQSITFALHGITDDIKIIEDAGEWTWLPEKNGIRYTAPQRPDFYTLTFYQVNKPLDTRLAHIKVYPPLKASESEILIEDYETAFLQVKDGVPPYLWIAGGKGQIEQLNSQRDQIRYRPGKIIGPETLTVYDSTGASIDIQITVKGLFRISPNQQSLCLDKATITFHASGGEPPYTLTPPSQGGWQKISQTPESLTLKFTQPGRFEIIGTDQSGHIQIATITIDPLPCHSTLNLHPPGPLYQHVKKTSRLLPQFTVSIQGPSTAPIKWTCQGPCGPEDLNTSQGKQITFFPPSRGDYQLTAQDQSGRTGQIAIHLTSDLFPLYAGPDNKIDNLEMQRALNAFFKPNSCCTRAEFYQLIQHFINAK